MQGAQPVNHIQDPLDAPPPLPPAKSPSFFSFPDSRGHAFDVDPPVWGYNCVYLYIESDAKQER